MPMCLIHTSQTSSLSKALTPAAATSPILADSETDPNKWSVMNVGGLSFTSTAFKMMVAYPGFVPFATKVTGSVSVAYNAD